MAAAEEKATPCFPSADAGRGGGGYGKGAGDISTTGWTAEESGGGTKAMDTTVMIRPVGIQVMTRAQTSHPLEPLLAAEISVAVATVRAAGATPEVRDGMRFVEVVLLEPEKSVVALADAYFFPPFQPSLLPRTKAGSIIPSKLPARRARLVVYNKKSNETSIWVVELTEVHAATRGGHHRGKFISSEVVPDVQPPMVVEVNVKVEEPGKNNVHNNAFYAQETVLKTELQAMRDCNSLSARHWIVRNTRTVNRTGQFTGYNLLPGSNCLPLAGPEAKFLRRAAFLKHNLWVTPYNRDEIYPGGEFLNQNPRVNEGLATWVKKNRSLEETNIVLWYVFGITHIPRLEDWPVMPVDRLGFLLMPHGFFNCSPAVDVPPSNCNIDLKENGVSKPVQNSLASKL